MSLDLVDPDAISLNHIVVDLSITGSEKYDRTPFVTESLTYFTVNTLTLLTLLITEHIVL